MSRLSKHQYRYVFKSCYNSLLTQIASFVEYTKVALKCLITITVIEIIVVSTLAICVSISVVHTQVTILPQLLHLSLISFVIELRRFRCLVFVFTNHTTSWIHSMAFNLL